nr:MAG: hypothetical protein [Microvirus sp.]
MTGGHPRRRARRAREPQKTTLAEHLKRPVYRPFFLAPDRGPSFGAPIGGLPADRWVDYM